MAGAIGMVIILVVVFPVAVLMTGAIGAAILGGAVKSDSDANNRDDDGSPNQYLTISETDYYDS